MEKETKGRARIVLFLWLLVAIFYTYLASSYIGAVMRDDEFGEYIAFAVQLAGSQGRSSDELVQLVSAKARELEIPTETIIFDVQDEEETLGLRVAYTVEIDIPLITDTAYRRDFQHAAAFNNR